MSWHGETGSTPLDRWTSCSATSLHGETTAFVKLCDSNNRIVIALLISRMFFIIHSILFEISELSFTRPIIQIHCCNAQSNATKT